MASTSANKLNTFSLTLLITVAIDSIRNLPATALFGSSLIFFFIFAGIFFLLPTALVSAQLCANVSEGGIYQWTRLAYGNRIGFLAIWLQWVSNVVWFPTMLSFIAGTAAYLINPDLAQSKIYLVSVILISFWLLTLFNLKGIKLSSRYTSIGAVLGLIIPMLSIITLFFIWLALGNPTQISFHSSNLIPSWHSSENWMALTAIMLGFAGMELATVHIKDVNNPQKTFPKALIISTLIILMTMILGSLAIAMVLPYDRIHLVDGTIETFSYFLSAYHLEYLTPIFIVLLVLGSLGNTISWIISPIKGLSQAGQQGFLPPFLQKENQHGVAQNLLITQAIIVSLVCVAFLLIPSVNGSYWFLSDLCTQLYILMYGMMFLAAIGLRNQINYASDRFSVPGKRNGLVTICIFGLLGCAITLFVGFIPPAGIEIGSILRYELLFIGGIAAMILPILFFYRYHHRKSKQIIRHHNDQLIAEALTELDVVFPPYSVETSPAPSRSQ